MAFFDVIGAVAVGIPAAVLSYKALNYWLSSTDSAPTTILVPGSPPTINRVAELINESKISEWTNRHPNRKAGEPYEWGCMDYWHHIPTKLIIRSKHEYDYGGNRQWMHLARVQEPVTTGCYSPDVVYPDHEQTQINHAWNRLQARLTAHAQRVSRAKITKLLDAADAETSTEGTTTQ